MTLLAPVSGRRRPSEQEAISLELVSGLLMIIGLAAFALLFYAIVTNDNIRIAVQGPPIPGVGLNVRRVQPAADAADQTPYYEIEPIPSGPAAAAGLLPDDRLIRIDDTDITPEMTLQQVQDLLTEPGMDLYQDDFVIQITVLRPGPNGTLTEQTRAVAKNVAPTPLVAYLKTFGFVVPLLVIVLGSLVFWLGTRLRRFDVRAARWSVVALMWLMVGLGLAAVWAFWVNGKGGIVTDAPFDFGAAFGAALPLLLAIIPLALAYRWLRGVIDELFAGDESLTSRNTRFAWSLLIPTLAVLTLVAARPLEQTFIKSLTDDEFGTARPVRFIGLENYRRLLDFQITLVECRRDDSGECATTASGQIVWERSDVEAAEAAAAREMSAAERRSYVRYADAGTVSIGGGRGLRVLGRDAAFLGAFGNTLQFTIISVALELLLGLAIALVVNMNFRGRGLMRTAMLVPWAIPTVVSAVLWQAIMRPDQTGILNKLFMDLGLIQQPQQWLAASGPWMASIVAVDVWKTSPFMALLILAGLQTIPADIYEAADVDGASKLRQFFSITLPLLRPTITVALIFRTLDALRVFDVFQVMLDTTRPSMATYNYNQLVLNRADGYASAVGVMIFILIFIFVIAYVRISGLRQEG